MRMTFPSDMPLHEQLQRAAGRKKVGHKHNKTPGPSKQKAPPKKAVMRETAWRRYAEQVSLFFAGHRDTMPKRPDGKKEAGK